MHEVSERLGLEPHAVRVAAAQRLQPFIRGHRVKADVHVPKAVAEAM